MKFPRTLPLRLGALVVLGLLSSVLGRGADAPRPELVDGLYAEITTPRGVIISELFYQKAPMTCANFVGLAEGNLGPVPRKPFYDGLTFHRVVPGFVVQGGDPKGTGAGDAGYLFPDEIVAGLKHDGLGVMQMANSGPDTNGSQFCFMLGAARHLDYAHTIFGHVVRGLDALPLIQPGDKMQVKILRRGRAAQKFRADERTFNALMARAPRLAPSHFEDWEGVLPPDQPWRVKYYETKLANLQRFRAGLAYVRLGDKFDPEFPGQTMQQFADRFRELMHLPAAAVLAVYFAEPDQWVLAAGGRPGIKRPDYTPRPGPQPAADQVEEMKKERKRVSNSVVEVINGLIVQFESN